MKLIYYPYELMLRHVFTVSSYSRISTPGVQVELEWEGIKGYGEASMPPYLGETTASVLEFLNKLDFSQFKDPFQLEDILTYVDAVMPGNTAAKAAIDIALHDLVGKLLNAPWYKIWGLNKDKTPSTTYTIGIDQPFMIRKKTEEVCNNFNILKIKLGSERDREIIETIRLVTSLPLAVDANQGWGNKERQQVLDTIWWLKEQNVVMIEQPLPKEKIEDMAWLNAHSPLPLYADESVQRLKDVSGLKDVFTGINIKLMKCTGMREAKKMIDLVQTLGMKTMIGCMTETSCAVSAAAQLSPGVDFADLDGHLLITNDLFKGMEIIQGKITLSNLPGIGIKPIHESGGPKPLLRNNI